MALARNSILRDILLPWQQAWVEDAARFKIGLWSRQTGKSFSTACEATLDCSVQPMDSAALWVVLSAGERQALEWMEKAKKWSEALKVAIDSYDESLNLANPLLSKATIRFGNGARIVAIPANPDTARGYSGNLILDEFAIHEKPFDIWAAIYPSITNRLTGEKRLRIVSTPKGRGNKFADLWEHNDTYSKHKVTIEDAVRMGLFGKDPKEAARQLGELRSGVDDADIWAQEYMCEFIDNSSVLLPYELIGKCESTAISDRDASAKLFIGMDIGRRHDLTVIATGVKHGDVLEVTDITELKKMPFSDQLEVLVSKAVSNRVQAVCIDSTGIGAMLAEEASKRLGSKAQGVDFNVKTKGELFTLLRKKFEERSIRIPVARELREDLHSVQRIVSTGGNITYSAPRNDDGHSDRAAALALLCRAASATGGYCQPPSRIVPPGWKYRKFY